MEEVAELALRFASGSPKPRHQEASEQRIAVCGLGSSEGQQDVARSVRALGGDAIELSGDLADVDVAPRLVEAAVSEFGGLDALVANAGVASPGNICDLTVADWDKMFAVNLRGHGFWPSTATRI
ncbi:SDR family NAD(P)-dependent oxidoreductase [Rhizobium sp. MC63]|uniref:SDR family NAD(P)-dependent oxidoreductase n=1 Tax=Rhizobium mulingense TaxID=3031128 RepID=A0ACC6N317_9HYPH|nr:MULTISPECIES: SDR family NAD(P)-dependent oxidoreductase [unclassified Rhizobium]MDF0699479.1 SDR family NAD(P)-dependent oxidoreductase [Rhizobium sp. MC63]MEA3519797.1 SDR family NAD(P)-dependent oxidoreductase [Rhizobium sp. MJ31]